MLRWRLRARRDELDLEYRTVLEAVRAYWGGLDGLAKADFRFLHVSTDYVFPKEVARAIPRAFWFWQGVTGLTTAWLLWRLRQIRQDRHALVYGEGPEAEESRRAPAV